MIYIGTVCLQANSRVSLRTDCTISETDFNNFK